VVTRRRTLVARGVEPAGADPRLELLTFFVSCEDAAACARETLAWLGVHAGVTRALVAASSTDATRLWGIAAIGVPAGRVGAFSLDLGDHAHPLVQALAVDQPTLFAPGALPADVVFGPWPMHVIPMWSEQRRMPVGLLMLRALRDPVDPVVAWASGVLGAKLEALGSHTATTRSAFEHERRLLFTIFNAVTDPLLLTDGQGKLIMGNARAERLLVAGDEASEGRRHAVALNTLFFSAALSAAAAADDAPGAREVVLVDPDDGSDLLFELLTAPARDADQATAMVSVLRDVTDLGRARMELDENDRKLRLADADVRAERHRLDLIMDSVADPIVVTGPSGETLMMNAPAERLFDVPPGGGQAEQRRVRANDAHFSSFVSSLLVSGRDQRWRSHIGLADPLSGRALPVEAVAGKILSEHNELVAVVTILHDRTEALENARLFGELKRASSELEAKVQAATAELASQNELLRRQALELEQASLLKSQFLANMSHEFRTPLNAILGYTSMLLDEAYGDVSPAQRRTLSRVDANGRHLLSLINDILDISRIEAGRMPLSRERVHLQALVSEVTQELEPVITRSPVVLDTRVPADLPVLQTDRQKLKQILVNLLSNALKFTPDGSICIRADHEVAARLLHVHVSDTGIGIAPAHQQRVFEDFQQVDNSPTREYPGTGLGLAICRRLATMLQGRLSLTSAPGVGSTFTLTLPVGRTRVATGLPDQSASDPAPAVIPQEP
jgi:signal transduction histidine kinase